MSVFGRDPDYRLWTPKRGIDDFVRSEFTVGGCVELALLLREKLGGEIWGEVTPGTRGSGTDLRHAWVVTKWDDDICSVDINGIHATGYARTRFVRDDDEGDVIKLSPSVLAETSRELTAWAARIIKSYPWYFGIAP